MGLEFELKYRAADRQHARILAACPGGYTETVMTTSYYDTPDGALSRLRWTLRHRQEGARHVCTLKTPASGAARGEWELECEKIEDALAPLARASGENELLTLTAGGLVLACGARFTRLAKVIEGEGFAAELALDKGVLINGEKQAEFSEVELELKSGSQEALMAFAERFAHTFALEQQPRSKYARARDLGREDQHGI